MRSNAFLFYQFKTMRKYSLTLFFLQLVASAVVMMAEANTVRFEHGKTSSKPAKERDLEIETNQETDVLPDMITIAMHLYQ